MIACQTPTTGPDDIASATAGHAGSIEDLRTCSEASSGTTIEGDGPRGMGAADAALVIYESMYGNTHRIADGIATGMPDEGVTAEGVTVAKPRPSIWRAPTSSWCAARPTCTACRGRASERLPRPKRRSPTTI